jgi:hypothetical protein
MSKFWKYTLITIGVAAGLTLLYFAGYIGYLAYIFSTFPH